jgi:hypothetical protein
MKYITQFLLALWASSVTSANTDRKLAIQNDSKSKVEIYWIHPSTGETMLQSDPFVYSGASFNLNSFVSHAFEAREIPGKNGTCAGAEMECRVGYFTVNSNDGQQIFIDGDFNIKHQDNKSLARESAQDLLDDCEASVMVKVEGGEITAVEAVKSIKDCVTDGVAAEMEKAQEEIGFQTQIRTKMAESLENYTCADYDLGSSEPDSEEGWEYDGEYYDVDVHINRPASKIHVVHDFITEDECAAMEEAAKPILHKATVADGKGGSELSKSRKAMQAGIKIPWRLEEEGNLLASLSRRVYDYTNHVLDMDIDEHGQEDLMSIQYEGRGENDEEPDRYMPHCDGDCNGMPFKTGNRMATMVIYCTVPTKGGATNFRNSGLHIVPKAGSATFFSYIDPVTMVMDNSFTEHSGCPVVEGEKKIVTQWVRYGVDKENPWDSFNTLGIKKTEEDDW